MIRKNLPVPAAVVLLFFSLAVLPTGSSLLAAENGNTLRCGSVTLDNAASILDVKADDLQVSSHDLMVSPDEIRKNTYRQTPYNCTIRSKSNFLKSISYITYTYNDPGQAHAEMTRMGENFASVSKVDPVPDTGDAAFWAGDRRFQRLVAVKGGVVIDILNPKDFTLQKQVMDLVLPGK